MKTASITIKTWNVGAVAPIKIFQIAAITTKQTEIMIYFDIKYGTVWRIASWLDFISSVAASGILSSFAAFKHGHLYSLSRTVFHSPSNTTPLPSPLLPSTKAIYWTFQSIHPNFFLSFFFYGVSDTEIRTTLRQFPSSTPVLPTNISNHTPHTLAS